MRVYVPVGVWTRLEGTDVEVMFPREEEVQYVHYRKVEEEKKNLERGVAPISGSPLD